MNEATKNRGEKIPQPMWMDSTCTKKVRTGGFHLDATCLEKVLVSGYITKPSCMRWLVVTRWIAITSLESEMLLSCKTYNALHSALGLVELRCHGMIGE